MKNLRVVIVGAGIGGLQTALALGTDGHEVVVLEAAKEFLEVRVMSVHESIMYFSQIASPLLSGHLN